MRFNNRYYLMRHGESLANLAHLIVSLPESGKENFGLTELGKSQAQGAALKSGLDSSVLVVTSDFLRTRETAAIVCKALGALDAQAHQGLRERGFGELEGTSSDGYSLVWEKDSQDVEHQEYGVESCSKLARRMLKVVYELDEAYRDRDILLVSHGDPLRFLQLAVSNRPLSEHLRLAMFEPAEMRKLL